MKQICPKEISILSISIIEDYCTSLEKTCSFTNISETITNIIVAIIETIIIVYYNFGYT